MNDWTLYGMLVIIGIAIAIVIAEIAGIADFIIESV